ncbi:related to Protein YSC84 [Saccharomycodes ludwigii]|uniref:Related to Protein YSC84 n=1 Tax=Saccharomycodes ludwigii TaxID=36035 RepID=A0A376B1K0_9ASCO|nr:hypothetical protein SCDLUD_003480 [Saccharomycodes ludwigii]KAH3900495.1 hypothetical protein SCDLUD_003480 [Saccharomycodes ludwigii]SSD58555.1 related to Protein YSC84 [Saccharomycodes ludwigii]
MGINNPIPQSLKAETKKATKVLQSFVKPNQVFGADEVIPPHILRRAKGLAIITVFKAGFLFSGRAGSGIIISRLPDGEWSAPSAIALAGAGAGGMVGMELTDFVFILNTLEAVKTFSQFGSVTLGGNMSLAAGPLGRSAEAAATASTGSVASIFSYSKTKGLFAGVSLEGSVLVERREANRKVYGGNCTAKLILSGRVDPPMFADSLYRILDSKVFSYTDSDDNDDWEARSSLYDDIPSSFGSEDDNQSYYSRRAGGGRRRGGNNNSRYADDFDDVGFDNDFDDDGLRSPPNRRRGSGRRGGRSTYNDDFGYDDGDNDYDRRGGGSGRYNNDDGYDERFSRARKYRSPPQNDLNSRRRVGSPRGTGRYNDRDDDFFDDNDNPSGSGVNDYYRRARANSHSTRTRWEDDVYDTPAGGSSSSDNNRIQSNNDSAQPLASNPAKYEKEIGDSGLTLPKAVALYTFKGEQNGDLPFKKGDVITIIKKSDSQNDWWTGRVNGQEGIFPANYVELV